jgi:hypothetical protein
VSPNNLEELQKLIQSTRSKMRITKVVATRAVKTRNGDFFCGLSSAWSTTQDDEGGFSDGELSLSTGETSGMTLQEARVAQVLLNLEATMGALRAALSDEAISQQEFERREKILKQNTLAHLSRLAPGTHFKKITEAA